MDTDTFSFPDTLFTKTRLHPMSMPSDSLNPYSSSATVNQAPKALRALPGSCKTVFIIELVFCGLRAPLVALGFVGVAMIAPDDPLAQTAIYELATGIGMVGFGVLANIGLLMKKSWGVPLGYLALVASAGSIGTAVWQLSAQMDQFPEGSPVRVGVMIGGGLVFMLRIALMGLYLSALTKFSAWTNQQPIQ
jgi:hypothetical protein